MPAFIPPNSVPVKTTGRPIENPAVEETVIVLLLLFVSEALAMTDGCVLVTIGGIAYPRITPNKSISNPGGNAPSLI